MPLYTSARTGSRYSNLRTRGFNGYSETNESIQFWEASGFYLENDDMMQIIGEASLKQTPLLERASESARMGDRVNFSVSVVGATHPFSITPTNNLGAVMIYCSNQDYAEYNWSFTVAYDGPACGGKIRATGISGSVTTFGGASVSLPFGLTGPTGEEGTDYGTDTGQRTYVTKDIIAADGIPWSSWQ